MVAGSAARILRAPGRIIIGPTDAFFGGTYPYGGTEVGKTSQCALQPIGHPLLIEAEGLGCVSEILEGSQRYVFACFLRGWDPDAIAQLFAGWSDTGENTQHPILNAPGLREVGSSALGRAVEVVFVPEDTLHVPAIRLFAAVPNWSDGAQIAFQRGSEFGLPITFECLRNSAGQQVQIAHIEDML